MCVKRGWALALAMKLPSQSSMTKFKPIMRIWILMLYDASPSELG